MRLHRMLPRIYYPGPLQIAAVVTLEEASSHHLLKVLRLKPGEPIILFNSHGGEYTAILQNSTHRQRNAVVKIEQWIDINRESPLHIHLGQAISRAERMDYAIQKSVELGVKAITPLRTSRCGVQFNRERGEHRVQHWQRIVISACEQSGRCVVPAIAKPQDFSAFLSHPAEIKLIGVMQKTEQLPKVTQQIAPQQVILLIGPEGGFTEAEIAQAVEAGYQPFSLGPRVLRTETAPVVGITLLQHWWGDVR